MGTEQFLTKIEEKNDGKNNFLKKTASSTPFDSSAKNKFESCTNSQNIAIA